MAEDGRERLESRLNHLKDMFALAAEGKWGSRQLRKGLQLGKAFDEASGDQRLAVWETLRRSCATEALHHQNHCNNRAVTALSRMVMLSQYFDPEGSNKAVRGDMVFHYDLIASLRSFASGVLFLSAQASPEMKDTLMRDIDDTFSAATNFAFEKPRELVDMPKFSRRDTFRILQYNDLQAQEILPHISVMAEFAHICLEASVFLETRMRPKDRVHPQMAEELERIIGHTLFNAALSLEVYDRFQQSSAEMEESGKVRFMAPPLKKPDIG